MTVDHSTAHLDDAGAVLGYGDRFPVRVERRITLGGQTLEIALLLLEDRDDLVSDLSVLRSLVAELFRVR